MATLQSGQTISIQLAEGESYTVTPSGTAQVSTRGVSGSELSAPRTLTSAQTFGPYTEAGAISIACLGGTVDYTQAGGPVYQDPTTGALVVGGVAIPLVKILAMSAVPIAHTGTIAPTILAEVPIPAGVMGPNGALRVTAYWSMTNNANSKNLVISWGGISAQIWSAGLSSVAGAACQLMVSNRGATGSQVFTSTGTGVSFGTLPGFGTASEDTTIAQRIRFTGNLSNAGDTLTLERYVVELLS